MFFSWNKFILFKCIYYKKVIRNGCYTIMFSQNYLLKFKDANVEVVTLLFSIQARKLYTAIYDAKQAIKKILMHKNFYKLLKLKWAQTFSFDLPGCFCHRDRKSII